MKTIIVATDFSTAALNAANYGADMAFAIQADLLLVHMYQIPINFANIPVPMSLDDLIKDTERELERTKQKLLENKEREIKITTLGIENAFFPGLKKVCEEIQPYAVILGNQGSTAIERLLFGSNTIYAMKHLMWPLITVPASSCFLKIKKIGLACDLEKVADTVPVEELQSLVKDLKAELHILNTGSNSEYNPDIVFQSEILKRMIGKLHPIFHFISSENIDEGIINFVEKNNIDLLVTLPKNHTFLQTLTHKSHTKQFILHSHVPVMSLHESN